MNRNRKKRRMAKALIDAMVRDAAHSLALATAGLSRATPTGYIDFAVPTVCALFLLFSPANATDAEPEGYGLTIPEAAPGITELLQRIEVPPELQHGDPVDPLEREPVYVALESAAASCCHCFTATAGKIRARTITEPVQW